MKKYNILIVEDEPMNIKFLERVILKLNYTVIASVQTAKEAIELAKKESIHVIFMDINLKGPIDGISCAKTINQHKKTPIIYTTSFSDSQTINEAIDSNVFGYLIKPFDLKDVEAVLNLTIKKNYFDEENTLNTTTSSVIDLSESYRYCLESKTLFKEEELIALTKRESALFYELCKNFNKTVSNDYLLTSVWDNKNTSLSSIRDTILRLRKKIPELSIKTLSGIGYTLVK